MPEKPPFQIRIPTSPQAAANAGETLRRAYAALVRQPQPPRQPRRAPRGGGGIGPAAQILSQGVLEMGRKKERQEDIDRRATERKEDREEREGVREKQETEAQNIRDFQTGEREAAEANARDTAERTARVSIATQLDRLRGEEATTVGDMIFKIQMETADGDPPPWIFMGRPGESKTYTYRGPDGNPITMEKISGEDFYRVDPRAVVSRIRERDIVQLGEEVQEILSEEDETYWQDIEGVTLPMLQGKIRAGDWPAPPSALTGELGSLERPDGRTSDEYSISTELDGRYANVPLLVKGQQGVDDLLAGAKPTPQQQEIAIERAKERMAAGATLPFYDSMEEAVSAAQERSQMKGVGEPGAPESEDILGLGAEGVVPPIPTVRRWDPGRYDRELFEDMGHLVGVMSIASAREKMEVKEQMDALGKQHRAFQLDNRRMENQMNSVMRSTGTFNPVNAEALGGSIVNASIADRMAKQGLQAEGSKASNFMRVFVEEVFEGNPELMSIAMLTLSTDPEARGLLDKIKEGSSPGHVAGVIKAMNAAATGVDAWMKDERNLTKVAKKLDVYTDLTGKGRVGEIAGDNIRDYLRIIRNRTAIAHGGSERVRRLVVGSKETFGLLEELVRDRAEDYVARGLPVPPMDDLIKEFLGATPEEFNQAASKAGKGWMLDVVNGRAQLSPKAQQDIDAWLAKNPQRQITPPAIPQRQEGPVGETRPTGIPVGAPPNMRGAGRYLSSPQEGLQGQAIQPETAGR